MMKGKQTITRRRFLKTAGVTAAAFTLSGFPTIIRGKEKIIEFGAVEPLTGKGAKWGTVVVQGEELAVSEINKAGGIKSLGGAKLAMSKHDTESKPETGITAAERAIQKGIIAILGTAGSSVAMVVTQVAEKNKIPMVVVTPQDPKIMQRGFKYTFRVTANAEVFVPSELAAIAAMVDEKTKKKVRTIAHMYEDSAYGQAENVIYKRDASKFGLELILSQAYPGGTTDLTPYVNKIKSLNPDFVGLTGFFFDTCNFVRTIKEQNFNPMGYLIEGNSDEFLTEIKKDSNFAFTYLLWNEGIKIPGTEKKAMEVNERFKKQFGMNMDGWAMLGYVSTYVLKDALERAASTDPNKLRKALAETNLTGPKGNIMATKGGRVQFDEIGENKNAIIIFGQVLNGKREVTWPPEYKTAEPVFPVPKWSERP